MLSLVVNLILTYFTLKFVLWLYGFIKDDQQQTLLINNSKEKIDPKPLNLPPDPKISLKLSNINRIKDTNFKNLLVKNNKQTRNHLTVSVTYG